MPSGYIGTLTAAAVIATRNRPEPLRRCLASLEQQSTLPEIVIVDSSDDTATRTVAEEFRGAGRLSIRYEHTAVMSAAQQRNSGAHFVSADIVFFFDDDVVIEPAFVEEILALFEKDAAKQIGGISGTITNQVYSSPRGLNRFLLSLCIGKESGSYAGRLLGPAINFLPEDGAGRIHQVEWLPSTCTAYRTEVFRQHEFASFQGYSFAEDVHLSARVAKTHTLLNTTRARVFHEDLGQFTHKNWNTLGESMFLNRHSIMTGILGRTAVKDHLRLLFFELIYSPMAYMAGGVSRQRVLNVLSMCTGKSRAAVRILFGRRRGSSPPGTNSSPAMEKA